MWGAGAMQFDFELREECEEIKQCYCIKLTTQCGWCKATNQASLAMGDCKEVDWVIDPEKCPQLYCAETFFSWAWRWWWFRRLLAPLTMTVLFVLASWLWIDREEEQVGMEGEALDFVSRSLMFESGQASLCRNFDNVSGWDLTQAPLQAREFFATKRTFETFRMGLQCPPHFRLPTTVQRKRQLSVTGLTRTPEEEGFGDARVPQFRIFATLRLAVRLRSPLSANMPAILGLMMLSSLFLLAFGLCAQLLEQRAFWTLAQWANENQWLITALELAVSALLPVYAVDRVMHYWEVREIMGWVQAHMHDVGIVVGPSLGETEEDWRARYTLYRHLMLCFFFSYQPFTPYLQFAGWEPLLECGLLEEEEVDALAGAHSSPQIVAEAWLSAWIQAHLTDYEVKEQAIQCFLKLRGSLGDISHMVEERAPLSFDTLFELAMYLLCWVLPYGPIAQMDYENRKAVISAWHVMIVLSKGVLIAFYTSMIHFIRHLQTPFDHLGLPEDSLSPVDDFNITERKLRDYLACYHEPRLPPMTEATSSAASMESS